MFSKKKKDNFYGTVESDGPGAMHYVFTGKLVSRVTYVTSSWTHTRTFRLYELPDGYYRAIRPDGSVTKKLRAEDVRNEYPELARRARLVKVVDLDKYDGTC